jgi:hypothetical protein
MSTIRSIPRIDFSDGSVWITVRLIKDTGSAWLVEMADEPRDQVWLPRSQIHASTPRGFLCYDIRLPSWLWRKVHKRI